MPYTVRVLGVEVVCDSLEDVEKLIAKYGGGALEHKPPPSGRRGDGGRGVPGGLTARDAAVLDAVLEGGARGVPSEVLEGILGRRGKALPGALHEWAIRVGVARDQQANVFEVARIGSKRGWKLRTGALATARKIRGGA